MRRSHGKTIGAFAVSLASALIVSDAASAQLTSHERIVEALTMQTAAPSLPASRSFMTFASVRG
jgi:hypothetical protein